MEQEEREVRGEREGRYEREWDEKEKGERRERLGRNEREWGEKKKGERGERVGREESVCVGGGALEREWGE